MRLVVVLAFVAVLGTLAQAEGTWWLGISLGGTHFLGAFVEYREGETGVLVSLGTAVPWRLNDLSLAFQLRRYPAGPSPAPYLGLGGGAFFGGGGGSWGWLASLDLSAGLQWGPGGGMGLELGAILHYFLAVHWEGSTGFNSRTLILPALAFEWAP